MKRLMYNLLRIALFLGALAIIWQFLPSQSNSGMPKPSIFGGGAGAL